MSTPLTADRMVSVLRAEGVHVVEHPGWRTHSRDAATGKSFGPVHGVLIHHTAATSSLSVVYGGRPDLPGPCAHAHLAKDGTVTLVSAGRANHAGLAARNAMNAVINESSTHPHPSAASGTVDGNDALYGIEIENRGDGRDPYPAEQYTAAVRWAAAICRAYGWSADSVVGHKETSIEGKIDPTFDMGTFRRDVAKQLGAKPSGSTKPAPKPAPTYAPFPGASYFRTGRSSALITAMGRRLVAVGCGRYKVGPGPSWTGADRESYAAWQRHLGYSGRDADGIPGAASWAALKVPRP